MKRPMVTCLALLASAAALAATPTPDAAHQVLAPAGPQAAHIGQLWNLFVVICAVVFGAILAVLLVLLRRTPRTREEAPGDLTGLARAEGRITRRVTLGVAASTVLLLVLVVASVFTDRAIARMSLKDAVTLEVTAHQWWWTVQYLHGENVSDIVETANEIHIPVGRPVIVRLRSDDVIHSLWLPSLAGKRDLIPGRTAQVTFRADRPGTYRGQCAEFCGYQHALMGLVVTAEPQDRFDAWLQAQRQPAAEPSDAQAVRGRTVFQATACAMCHTVNGTPAQGKHGPDLTHLASRQTLAAGTLPNTRDALARWIQDPQQYKPGTNMPAVPLSREDLDAVVTYLGSLR